MPPQPPRMLDRVRIRNDAGTLWNSPTAAFKVAATNVYTNLVNSRVGRATACPFPRRVRTQIITMQAIRPTPKHPLRIRPCSVLTWPRTPPEP